MYTILIYNIFGSSWFNNRNKWLPTAGELKIQNLFGLCSEITTADTKFQFLQGGIVDPFGETYKEQEELRLIEYHIDETTNIINRCVFFGILKISLGYCFEIQSHTIIDIWSFD